MKLLDYFSLKKNRNIYFSIFYFFIFLSVVNLLTYISSTNINFPIQDEWGYIQRLNDYKQNSLSLFDYLFNKYQIYYIPGLFAFFAIFFKLFNLDFYVIQIIGILLLVLSGILVGYYFMKSTSSKRPESFFFFISLFLLVTSLNFWATINQSIESVIEPLVVIFTFLSTYFLIESLKSKSNGNLKILVSLFFYLLSISFYSTYIFLWMIVMLIFFWAHRHLIDLNFLLQKKMIILIIISLFVPMFYLGKSPPHQLNHIKDIALDYNFFIQFIYLLTNALINQNGIIDKTYNLLRFFSSLIFLIFIFYIYYNFFTITKRKKLNFLFPISLLSIGLITGLEIALLNNELNFGSTPRYSIHMIFILIGVIFYLGNDNRLPHSLKSLFLLFLLFNSLASQVGIRSHISNFNSSFREYKNFMCNVKGPMDYHNKPDLIGKGVVDSVYPSILFLNETKNPSFIESCNLNDAIKS